jgi:23S rRNA (guanine745-N1)-methyltransferase
MPITPFQQLKCPLDNTAIIQNNKTWHCENKHTFDTAKQGYINLLPVQNKRSLNPGDNKEMVAARNRFLESEFYAPIAKILSQQVLDNLLPTDNLSCLDAGCGEGYYLRQLSKDIQSDQNLHLIGLDISKWAVLHASKLSKDIRWIVGSNANLPIQDNTLDWVFSLFGFPVYAEFERVLKIGGKLLLVDAGEHHLKELREVIYPTLKPAKEKSETTPEGFSKISKQHLSFTITLYSKEEIADLLAMTPHLYRANAEGKSRVQALTSLTLTVDVNITTLLCQ